jgi:hypothetical protein
MAVRVRVGLGLGFWVIRTGPIQRPTAIEFYCVCKHHKCLICRQCCNQVRVRFRFKFQDCSYPSKWTPTLTGIINCIDLVSAGSSDLVSRGNDIQGSSFYKHYKTRQCYAPYQYILEPIIDPNVIAINYSLLLSTRHTIFNFVVSPQYFSYGYPLQTSLCLNMQLAHLNNGMCTPSMA